MTALLEFKQKIKGIYAQYEMYLLPLLKFVLALVYFIWINTNMGYMTALDNIFVVLILSLICCILPSGMMIFAGFALMVGHCYALGIEVAAFLLVLILFMMILFLRFSSGKNIVLVFTPLAFAFDIPVLLPIGCGLLSSAVSALPAAGGVIIYYFVRTVRIQSQALLGMDSDIVGKLTLLSDSLMKNGEMWLTLIALYCDHAGRKYESWNFNFRIFTDHLYCGCGTGWNHTGVLCVWWRLYKNGTSGI